MGLMSQLMGYCVAVIYSGLVSTILADEDMLKYYCLQVYPIEVLRTESRWAFRIGNFPSSMMNDEI